MAAVKARSARAAACYLLALPARAKRLSAGRWRIDSRASSSSSTEPALRGRVAPAGYPAGALPDPDLEISTIRLHRDHDSRPRAPDLHHDPRLRQGVVP